MAAAPLRRKRFSTRCGVPPMSSMSEKAWVIACRSFRRSTRSNAEESLANVEGFPGKATRRLSSDQAGGRSLGLDCRGTQFDAGRRLRSWRGRKGGELAAKNNQSRYNENDYRRQHSGHEGIPRSFLWRACDGFDRKATYRTYAEPIVLLLRTPAATKRSLPAQEMLVSAFRQNFDNVSPGG